MSSGEVGSPFVGDQRKDVVRELVEQFRAVTDEGSPRAVLLDAPPGWGKTRIVQEFYTEVAAQQPAPPYWPPRLVSEATSATHARKEIFPGRVDVPPGASMPWFWWGLSCTRSAANKPLGAVLNATEQVEQHAGPLLRKRERRRKLTVGALEGVGRVAGLLGLGLPITDLTGLPKKAKAALETAREWQRDLSWQREGGEIEVGGGADLAFAQEMATALTKLSRGGLPIIVAIEDAHDADPTLVRFLELLTSSDDAAVLVVACGWTSRLRTQAAEGPGDAVEPTFGAWFTDVAGASHTSDEHRYRWVELPRLANDSLAEIVRHQAPHTDPDVVDAFLDRADGNPFVLQLLLDLPSVSRSTVDGAIRCSRATLARLPADVVTLYQDIFAAFPESIRTALCIAALQGEEFSTGFVEHMGERITNVSVVEGLREAEEPRRWVRRLDDLVREFREATIYEVCRDRQPEVLTEEEQDEALSRLLDHIRTSKHAPSWHDLSPRGQRVLLGSHLWLVEQDAAPADDDAADSAHLLARLDAAERDWTAALEHARKALDWQRRADDGDARILQYGMLVVEMCQEVGDAQQRIAAARETSDLHTHHLGTAHEDTIRADLALSEALRSVRDIESALELGRDVLARASSNLGPAHQLTIQCRTAFAWTLQVAGDVHGAVDAGRRALDDATAELGSDHPITLTCLNNLARYLRSAGHHREAAAVGEQALAAREQQLGRAHPQTITSRSNLAWIYRADGQYTRALDSGRVAFEDARDTLGEHHPSTLAIQTTMATFLSANGYRDEAIAYAQDAVDKRARVLGPDHFLTMNSRATLANALRRAGRVAEAVEIGEEVLAYRERLMGLDHPTTLRSCISVAAAHRNANPRDVDRAVELTRRAYRAHIDRWGPEHPDTLKAMAALAVSLRAAGDHDSAIELGQEVLARREAVLGRAHPDTVTARAALARSYRSAGRHGEALGLAEEALELRENVLGEHHPETRRAARLVDELRDSSGSQMQ